MNDRWRPVARRIRVPMGFIFAGIFLFLAHPTPSSLVWSLLLVAPGLALRGYASGYVKKNSQLATTGPYAYTRNPLYLGSMLIAFGFALGSRSIFITVALIILFAAIYIPVIRAEEEFLEHRFPDFKDYALRVPRLLPRLTRAIHPIVQPASSSFSATLYRQHREYNAGMGAGAIYLILLLRLYLHR